MGASESSKRHCRDPACAECTKQRENIKAELIKSFEGVYLASVYHGRIRAKAEDYFTEKELEAIRIENKVGQTRLFRPDHKFTAEELRTTDPSWLLTETGPYVPQRIPGSE